MEPETTAHKNTLTVPLAIVVAGALIAGAVFLSQGENKTAETAAAGNAQPAVPAGYQSEEIAARPFDEKSDHFRGNPDAPIILLEYSDTECPFCKTFHNTLQRLIERYGKAGSFAWAYRHFPLSQLHSRAPKEAEALECAAEAGGNTAFWKYTDRLFEVTPSNDGLNPSELPAIAEYVGLDRTALEQCLSSGRYAARVGSDYEEARAAGGTGTPFNVLLLKNPVSGSARPALTLLYERYRDPRTGLLPISFSADGLRMSLSGAIPYEIIAATIDELLKP